MTAEALLTIENLALTIPVGAGSLKPVRGINLDVRRGETLGIVGESGSGKSMTILSILGLQPGNAKRSASKMMLDGIDLSASSNRDLGRKVRGLRAAMIFQEPMTSLNPTITIGKQMSEVMLVHGLGGEQMARARAVRLLERVGITGAIERLDQYPHQFSGGQRQRIMIAMALMSEPQLLIADEPTTAVDVTVQAEILRLIVELQREFKMAVIIVSHNLGILSRVADRIAVMYAGQLVEQAPVRQLFEDPRHPYTRALLAALPERTPLGDRLGTIHGTVPSLVEDIPGCAFAARCLLAEDRCRVSAPPMLDVTKTHQSLCWFDDPVRVEKSNVRKGVAPFRSGQPILKGIGLVKRYAVARGLFSKSAILNAVNGVDIALNTGELTAVVGESGCGKSTVSRLLLGLERPDQGSVMLGGRDAASISPVERARLIQPVFQDPRASLNPYRRIRDIVRRPLDVHEIGSLQERIGRVEAILSEVGLPKRVFDAFPSQLSGGQRQRVALARALILEPKVLLCDEPTSALDVSVQGQILNLLSDLRAKLGLSIMLITHDLAVVECMADRVAVMYLGQIVEEASRHDIFARPRHPYTRALIRSAATVSAGNSLPQPELKPGFPNPLSVPPGCSFHLRCPIAVPRCASEVPVPQVSNGNTVRCHLADLYRLSPGAIGETL